MTNVTKTVCTRQITKKMDSYMPTQTGSILYLFLFSHHVLENAKVLSSSASACASFVFFFSFSVFIYVSFK